MKISEEVYTHNLLWGAAERLSRRECSQKDRFYLDLSALLMAYLAFEAFVNFLGEKTCPELWINEKDAFRGQGDTLEAKIGAISRRCHFQWKKGGPPYQDIKNLKKFRDSTVHGKLQRSQYSTQQKEDGTHIRWSHPFYAFATPTKVQQSMDSIKAFCQSLLVAAHKRPGHALLPTNAFSGLLGSASGEP